MSTLCFSVLVCSAMMIRRITPQLVALNTVNQSCSLAASVVKDLPMQQLHRTVLCNDCSGGCRPTHLAVRLLHARQGCC
jgi:hypothetical protein